MIRKLKVILLAALAVSALGALGASVALGHTPAKFTAPGAQAGESTTLTLGKDGTGKTAHLVFDIFNAATMPRSRSHATKSWVTGMR